MPIAGLTVKSPWAAGARSGAVVCSRAHRSHLRHRLQSPLRLRVPQDTQPPRAFEDAQVDFGSVEAGPTDLARMLLVEFALVCGNDWSVIPVELDVGSLYRTRSLVITDTFGIRMLIKSSSELGAPHSTWRMFQHSYLRGSGFTVPASNLFFLSPSLRRALEGTPLEEVLLFRDESLSK